MKLNDLPVEYLDKLRARIEKNYIVTESGCWEWQGYKFGYGYGGISVKHKPRTVHRVYYQLVRGFLPDNLVIDHICRNPPCFNPDHLEPVTSSINTLRGQGITAQNARKTLCVHGHKLTEDNVISGVLTKNKGKRICKTCSRIRCAARDRQRTLEYHAKGLTSKGKPLKRKIDRRYA